MSHPPIPPILASVIACIAAAVPARGRATFLDLLLGAAATKSGHVTDAILASGLSRGWSTYYWFLEQGRWSWLRVWAALLEVLTMLFRPAVWYAVIDDSVVERVSTEAPGSLTHHNHNAKPNRPKFLRGQGWLCLAAVIERNDFAVGAVPLLLRLVRRGANRGKLRSAGLLLHLLGQRLGHVRLLLDAWFMRAWLIHRALTAGHTVIGCVRRDLALFDVPKPPRKRRQGRPLKYGARLTPERVAALPEHRSAQILYGKLEVARYRTCLVAARFLRGRVVEVAPVWWTPTMLLREVSLWPRRILPVRRSSGARWSSWFVPGVTRPIWLASSNPRPRRSAIGWPRPIDRRAAGRSSPLLMPA